MKPGKYAFLHARCVRDRRFYIMRFAMKTRDDRLPSESGVYFGTGAHIVDHFDFEPDDPSGAPSFSANQLREPPACPCCGGPYWCMCGCGKIHCAPRPATPVITLTCPWCGGTGTYEFGSGGDFSLDGALG